MKLYRTKEDNVINLEQVAFIYRPPLVESYFVACTNGLTYEVPELGEEDIDKIMEYNDYLIK